MVVATVVITVLLAATLAWSAVRKLSHQEEVVQSYRRAGVPEGMLNGLAMILLAGAAGLILGLFWAPIGIAAAIGLVCYFVVAVAFHIRANDTQHLSTPLMLAVIAAIALVLRIATL
jgi:hypothetical protein